jgi:pSer/pThr/pTyr-binding forkhead associated (FHA) protein
MDVLGGTRIRREATPATVNLRRCKLIITKGAQRGSEFVVGGDVVRIGKATDNDLVISDETVSRNHFEIVRDGKGYLVRDLQSTNGTFLDGAEIKEAYLRAGSVVGAGAVRAQVHAVRGAHRDPAVGARSPRRDGRAQRRRCARSSA